MYCATLLEMLSGPESMSISAWLAPRGDHVISCLHSGVCNLCTFVDVRQCRVNRLLLSVFFISREGEREREGLEIIHKEVTVFEKDNYIIHRSSIASFSFPLSVFLWRKANLHIHAIKSRLSHLVAHRSVGSLLFFPSILLYSVKPVLLTLFPDHLPLFL